MQHVLIYPMQSRQSFKQKPREGRTLEEGGWIESCKY